MKTPDDGQRNCPKHVEFFSKNKFEKLVHLVGFIIRIYHDARPSERQNRSGGIQFSMVDAGVPNTGHLLVHSTSNNQLTAASPTSVYRLVTSCLSHCNTVHFGWKFFLKLSLKLRPDVTPTMTCDMI